MGYTTEFSGQINIEPPLNAAECSYLNKFSETRRMACKQGPYYVERDGLMGQDRGSDVIDYNQPPDGQPGLWCQWIPTEDGTAIEWNGTEKFYEADRWMAYLIDHFISGKAADEHSPAFDQHTANGEIEAHGEDHDDIWKLRVTNNKVEVLHGKIVFEKSVS